MSQLLLDKLDWLAGVWLEWMISMSIHVAVLVALLMAIEFCLRGASARLRFALWALILVRLVVPPDWAAPTGWMWWTSNWWPTIVDWSPAATTASEALANHTIIAADSAVTEPSGLNASTASGNTLAAWPISLLMVWLGAVVCQLGVMLYGWILVESWLSQAKDVTDPEICNLLSSARRRVGLKRPVHLRDSGHCTTPLVVGWTKPIILLPTAVLETLKPAELEAVLIHELTHLSRGDCWWRVVQSILRAIYFFHPAVWLAHRALSRTCEEACDELTVQALAGKRRDYAEAIFKAAAVIGYRGPHLAMNMLGDVLPVKHRLARILDPRLPQSTRGSWQHAALVMLLALILLPTGQRNSQAIPPQAARLSDLRLPIESPSAATSEQSPSNENQSNESIETTLERAVQSASALTTEEQQALEQLKSEHFEQRMQAYQTLAQIGTIHALPDLEAAFLNRSGLEQDAAERALKHVWELIRSLPAETNTSAKVYSQTPSENSYAFP